MPRAIWTGTLSFGLVSIPVGLYPATQEHEVRFHQFEKGTTSRIRYRRVNAETGEEVDYSDIVKGAELPDGEYVTLTDKELEEVEPKRTKAIEINDFVDLAAVDPVHYQKSYYLAPRGEGAGKPYALLAAAIDKSGRAGVASFVLRNKEHLAVIRPYQGILMLETMFFADEVRSVKSVIDNPPDAKSLSKRDLDMAADLIGSMTSDWEPEKYRDRYTERVNELVAAKSKDEKFETGEEEPEAKVVDLTAALKASVERARKSGGSAKSGKSGGKGESSKSEPELADLSKSDLYDLAKSLDIGGRSGMNRKDLEQAIRDAQSTQAAS
ncbi:Ku protein [Microlunatus elymi]|uniref:Non-homologous end joining protein Ku n=1 Tax=Microlunatus elymi TaxID=2596828 RepID=A0A516PY06_9ACTN|nr:Ku protein [Microlunatus elymi]QDP96046.1 Ku protein [Microlunatus elymi]